MLVVSMVLLVVAVVVAGVLAARVVRLRRALAAAEAGADQGRAALAVAEGRVEATEATAATLAAAHDEAQARAEAAEAAARLAAEDLAAAREAVRAAEAGAREATTLARGAQAEAEAARRQVRAAADAVAGHPGWVDVLARLEGVRAERTWRTVAPLDDAPGADRGPAGGLARGLEVELQWLRDVVGTPGSLHTLAGHDDAAPAGPADLVALLVAQEVLDVVGKRVEALDVGYARTGDGVRLEVSSPEAEHPVDPDGRLARLAELVAPLAGELGTEADVDGPGVRVRLVVPVAPAT